MRRVLNALSFTTGGYDVPSLSHPEPIPRFTWFITEVMLSEGVIESKVSEFFDQCLRHLKPGTRSDKR